MTSIPGGILQDFQAEDMPRLFLYAMCLASGQNPTLKNVIFSKCHPNTGGKIWNMCNMHIIGHDMGGKERSHGLISCQFTLHSLA